MKDDGAHFARACQSFSDGVYVLDLASGNLLTNPAFFSMLGYAPGEVPSTFRAWTELLHPDDRTTVGAVLSEYETGRSTHELQIRLRTRIGEWRWVLHRGQLEADAEKTPLRIVGLQLDINERTRALDALRDGERQLRAVFDAVPEGIAIWEMLYAPDGAPQDYRLLGINTAFGRQTGLSTADAVGQTGSEITGTSPPPHLETYNRVATQQDAAEYDTTAGSPARQFRVSVFALGERRFATTMRDITDRQRAAQAFAQRIRQLEHLSRVAQDLAGERSTAALLSGIAGRAAELLRAGSASVFVWDDAAQLLKTSAWHGSGPWRQGGVFRLGESIIGVVGAERSGVTVNDFRTSRLAHAFFLKQSSATAVIAEPLVHTDQLLGVLACDNEGTGRPFTPADEAALKLLAGLSAKALGTVQAFEAQQREAQVRARGETLRALGDMADGVAHDLNNRFAAIVGYVELIKLRGQAPDGLGRIETAISDAVSVIKRFQGFARQRATAPLGAMDLQTAVETALDHARTRWAELRNERAIKVQSALDELPPVLGDAAEIGEALINIISNAVEAMPEGGTLTFAGGAASAESAVLHISDTGVGMTESVRQKVFEPFFTTKGGRGSGLGLSIAYAIMERHGGQIDVASTLGRGTTVTLQFQRAPAAAAPAKPSPPAEPSQQAQAILVIAEEAQARESLCGLLRAAGLMVTEASGRVAALQRLSATPVDLVLVDALRMQRATDELVEAIRRLRTDVPVILLAHREDPGAVGTLPPGVDRVLPKTVPLEELLRIIAEVSAGARGLHGTPPDPAPLRPMSHRA